MFVLIIGLSETQAQKLYDPIDTFFTDHGTILIYPDRSWTYMEDMFFDGIMNTSLHDFIQNDTSYGYRQHWKNDIVITCTQNNIGIMKDTIWMCVLDSAHQDFCIPFDGRMTSGFGYRHGREINGVDIDLEEGDTIVKAGDPIGLGGNTGHSYGAHLHFEVRFYDVPIDPELIFNFKHKEVHDNLLVHKGVFVDGGYRSTARVDDAPGTPGTGGSNTVGSSGGSNSSAKTHKVRSGDTLSKIAVQYGTTVTKLCQLNGMKATDIIHIGQVIKVR
ncbi:MAG: LysM peptidoglycan-binding domain-containing protein [Crocinitomicaceae bacterium]|nr:LysM peptidoglycan-binding domain-containing protein [Crocinitomicaceae bacterium]